MKIENSSISMSAVHNLTIQSSAKTSTSFRIADQKDNSPQFFQNYLKQPLKSAPIGSDNRITSSTMSIKLLLLRRIFDAIAGRYGLDDRDRYAVKTGDLMDLRNESSSDELTTGTLWQKTVSTSTYYCESEFTSFEATGYATTSDGRTLSFGVELSLSRSFTSVYEEFESTEYILTDPLMIDIGSNVPSVSDMKFMFDLDADGTKEEISFAGKGNGFLALDLNGDGIINDGSELFGTKSGNGFGDLAKYDSDHNGWIDENDEIFDKLRVWTKDENGNDELINLKDADVGAIYLGHANTPFALTDNNNYAHGFIRSSGIYLKESGGVGMIQQLDLTS